MTLAIAAVLLTIAAPAFQATVRTNRIAAATNELVRSLQLARSAAVTRGVRVTVCKTADPLADEPTCDTGADTSWEEGWLVFIDRNNSTTRQSNEPVLQVSQPRTAGLSITGGTRFANFVSYSPSGVSEGANRLPNGTLTICLPSERRRLVEINSTGRIITTRSEEVCP